MPQARRIKQQPRKKKTRSGQRPRLALPWGLLAVILACGVVLGMLINGARNDNPRLGAGLKRILEPNAAAPTSDPEIQALIDNQSTEKDFEFYELLPDIERVMPDDLPEAEPTRAPENVDYFLQAASFRAYADAEKLRARLALQGFKSVTQAREVEGKGTYYRVRLGPYADKRKAKTAKNKLQKLGVRPFVYTVNKS